MVILYQECSSYLDSSKNMAAGGGGGVGGAGLIFPIYLYRKLSKSSCQKPLNRFLYNAENFFGDPLLRLLKPFGFVKKHGRQGPGLIFPIYLYRKL